MNVERPGFAVSLGRWGSAALVSGVLLPVATVIALVSSARGLRAWSAWGRLMQRIFRVRLEVQDLNHGRYHQPPYVFVQLNQRSLSETFVIHAAMPIPFQLFTNIEFALLPLGWCMWLTGSVVVVRQWPWQRRRALAKAIAKVRAGESFYISIEGGRAPEGTALPFKKGPALLAIEGGATVVPVVFDGTAQVLPHGHWRVRPGVIRVTLLEQISTRDVTPGERDRLTRTLERVASQRVREPMSTGSKANAN